MAPVLTLACSDTYNGFHIAIVEPDSLNTLSDGTLVLDILEKAIHLNIATQCRKERRRGRGYVDFCYLTQEGPDEGLREGPGRGAEIHARVEIVGNSSSSAQPSALVLS